MSSLKLTKRRGRPLARGRLAEPSTPELRPALVTGSAASVLARHPSAPGRPHVPIIFALKVEDVPPCSTRKQTRADARRPPAGTLTPDTVRSLTVFGPRWSHNRCARSNTRDQDQPSHAAEARALADSPVPQVSPHRSRRRRGAVWQFSPLVPVCAVRP